MLTIDQKRNWFEQGFLVLPEFFSKEDIDPAIALQNSLWKDRPSNVIVDDLHTGKRVRMSDVTGEALSRKLKINDLYLDYSEILNLSLNERLSVILQELMVEPPVLCNSLNFDFGSEQPNHLDSLYMTPPSPGNLAATWIALEDIEEDAGPLAYYPGSHMITQYRFSDGRLQALEREMPQWQEYMQNQIRQFGLKREIFKARKGDVFIWHAYLLHGGSPLKNPSQTRRSIVSHYFTYTDCLVRGMKLESYGCGFLFRKPKLEIGNSIADTESA